jgi:DMSO/TMAO reductase YedYZ heme-binding membrane subunit
MYVLSQGSTGWNNPDTFDSGLESGKWAIRFLLASLLMSPLNTYFGWKSAIKLRKPAGLWAFGFASVHILFYVREAKWEWLTPSMPFYLKLGLVGIMILGLLAATSNRWSMQRLGKNWKRLHRLVYFSGIAVVTHAMLATTMSKKLMFRDPQAERELKVHLVVLFVLLVVRIPLVRQWLKQVLTLLKSAPKSTRLAGESGKPELLSQIHGRESSVSVKPTFIILNAMPTQSELDSASSLESINLSTVSSGEQAFGVSPEEKNKIR